MLTVNPIGDFFVTFESKDWAISALALIAIWVSIWAASQTGRFNPRPLLQVVDATYDEKVPSVGHEVHIVSDVSLSFINNGNGPALDVRVVARGPLIDGGLETRFGYVEPGKQIDSLVEMFPTDNFGNPRPVRGANRPGLTMSWSQSPRVSRRHTMRIDLRRPFPFS
jgi:hypothetical protein